ncbi:glucosaminidase domain-containing protein [Ichthyobacterium seriolicida]|uniref:N-acetylmuramoyl-L-alanine amidase n=1 Tax=Ichthyobacterium seriolicida TaxID=242600 RepID=A0A1J1DX01_9FLAO|nr:glucosaminidase domain-containing protein [Ichthyobacterium seriolicida]BAV94377.1 N-acetylmuramoyl-L-alanine amidase [Ichthyobacterium seriolicida]
MINITKKGVFCFLYCNLLFSQNFQDRKDYIEKYKIIAIEEMITYGIPASITLAQGVLESGNGKSELSNKSNNHFGIKCHTSWEGEKVYHDDDEKGECFRKYKHPWTSYRDHSEFLVSRSRYAFLFDLDIDDYKAWAHGLKKAGYATDPKYAKILIKIIEDEELYKYDSMTLTEVEKNQVAAIIRGAESAESDESMEHTFKYGSKSINGIKYEVISSANTLGSICKKHNLPEYAILDYNDLSSSEDLKDGMNVFLSRKKIKVENGVNTYVIGGSESLYEVSQKLGIRLRWLEKRNNISKDSKLNRGDVLYVRDFKES